jgi:hypothetical protein
MWLCVRACIGLTPLLRIIYTPIHTLNPKPLLRIIYTPILTLNPKPLLRIIYTPTLPYLLLYLTLYPYSYPSLLLFIHTPIPTHLLCVAYVLLMCC